MGSFDTRIVSCRVNNSFRTGFGSTLPIDQCPAIGPDPESQLLTSDQITFPDYAGLERALTDYAEIDTTSAKWQEAGYCDVLIAKSRTSIPGVVAFSVDEHACHNRHCPRSGDVRESQS
jgi:hypothetical protein